MAGVRGWKIWYDDETTFSSKDGDWRSAPDDGVLFVVYFEGHPGSNELSRFIVDQYDRYFFDGANLFGGNHDSREDILGRYRQLGPEDIKRGKWTDNETWDRVRMAVMMDTGEAWLA